MELRDYQKAALEAVYRHLRTKSTNPCVVVPTGGGKTPIIARLCSEAVSLWSGRVYIVSHVKELLEQSVRHLHRDAPDLPVGIYSAGLGSKNLSYPVTVCGIQSIYDKDVPPADLVIVDEAHRIPLDGDGMYRRFIGSLKEKNPALRVIGFTATPYRTGEGMVTTSDGILNEICFEVGIRELIAKGYLSTIHAKRGTQEIDFSGLKIERGEFVQSQVEALMDDDGRTLGILSDLMTRAVGRKSILVFASGVEHGKKLTSWLRESGETASEIYGDTKDEERSQAVDDFRAGKIRFLVNCQVLTLGFDAPNVDCVALARPTASPGLYYQMLGRGFRIHDGKTDCLVLDFGGNVERHGPVDTLKPDRKTKGDGNGEAPAKTCPTCFSILPAAVLSCPDCGHEFPKREVTLNKPYEGDVLSVVETLDVTEVSYRYHTGKDSGVDSLRVDYSTGLRVVSEFVCLEHSGYAKEKAAHWWSRRSKEAAPETVSDALSKTAGLRSPKKITVSFSGKYPRILSYTF